MTGGMAQACEQSLGQGYVTIQRCVRSGIRHLLEVLLSECMGAA